MATLQTFIVLIISLTFVVYLGYAGDYRKYGFSSSISDSTKTQMDSMNTTMWKIQNSDIQINLGSFLGTFSFPNPFAIFLNGFELLKTIVLAPVTMINSLDFPDIIKFGLQVFFYITMVYLAFTWFKGQTA